jgi:putative MATE family efflux protein
MTELDEPINAPPLSPAALPTRMASLHQLIALALPVLAEHILHMAVGWNDTYLANHLPSHQADAGAAVGTIQYIFWFFGLFASAIGVGSTALIARATGSRTRRTVNSVCGQSILFAILLGIVLGASLLIFASPFADLTRLHGLAHDFALQYLRLLSPSVPFVIVMFVASACLRGTGDTLTPGIAMIVVDLVNITFSWGLTRGLWGMPMLGFSGIAIGTVIAYIAGGLLQFGILWFGRGKIKLHAHRLRPHWIDMKRILHIGLPNGLGDLLNFVANFVLIMVINQTDPTSNSSAAHNIAIRIESLSYMSGFAIAVAATTLVGQALGEKNPRKAERAAYFSFAIGGGFMALMGIAFIFLGRYPVALLADEPTVRHMATRCLFITGFCQTGFAAAIIFGGALRGAGDTISVTILQLASILTLRLGGVLVVGLWLHLGLAAIWVVLAGELIVRGALIYGRFLHGGWKRVQV